MSRRGRAWPLALALATACPASTPTPEPTASAPAPPAPSGEVTIAYPQEPLTLDPFSAEGAAPATRDILRLIMPSLESDTGASVLKVQPRPGATVDLQLREDPRWSDGTPITADDVRFTWQWARARPGPAAEGFDRVRDVVVESPTRARLRLDGPLAQWRHLFSQGRGILPRALGAKGSLARAWPVSGGPFVLTRWTAGLEMVFEPNPHAWGGSPRLARLRIRFVEDPLTALTLLRKGEVDGLGPYPTPDFARRSADAGAEPVAARGDTWIGLVLNAARGSLADARVRVALARSIDRTRVVEALLQDAGEPLRSAGASGGDVFGARDLSAARASLERAGWRGSGIRRRGSLRLAFDVAVLTGDEHGYLIARALAAQARDAGFEVRPVEYEAWQFWDRLDRGAFRAAIVTWRDHAAGSLRALAGRPFGRGGWTRLGDDRIEVALSEGAVERAHRLAASIAPLVPIARLSVHVAVTPEIRGVEPCASAEGPFCTAAQWSR